MICGSRNPTIVQEWAGREEQGLSGSVFHSMAAHEPGRQGTDPSVLSRILLTQANAVPTQGKQMGKLCPEEHWRPTQGDLPSTTTEVLCDLGEVPSFSCASMTVASSKGHAATELPGSILAGSASSLAW